VQITCNDLAQLEIEMWVRVTALARLQGGASAEER
jgi:hypothetical protein